MNVSLFIIIIIIILSSKNHHVSRNKNSSSSFLQNPCVNQDRIFKLLFLQKNIERTFNLEEETKDRKIVSIPTRPLRFRREDVYVGGGGGRETRY